MEGFALFVDRPPAGFDRIQWKWNLAAILLSLSKGSLLRGLLETSRKFPVSKIRNIVSILSTVRGSRNNLSRMRESII